MIDKILTAREKYPELHKLAQNIARDVYIKINERAPSLKTEAPYKEQYTLELVISELEKRV